MTFGVARVSVMVAALIVLAGCDDSVVVQVRTGAQGVDVAASTVLALPASMRDDGVADAPRIAELACGPSGVCPSDEGAVAIVCVADLCDPAPSTVELALGDVIDVDALTADARELLGHVDAINVVEASYDVPFNALTVSLPEIEIFWGPEGASHVDPTMGVVALGVAPAIDARAITRGAITLDEEGAEALSRYLADTSRRVRFFARTRVDLAPGDAFPEGDARFAIELLLEVHGTLR